MDRSMSLEQLDGDHWGDAPAGATGLMADVHRLRHVPVGELADGDLRMLLGQRVGAEFLIPIALERLVERPLAGDWYPGDLLRAVLHAGSEYWDGHPRELLELWAVRESLDKLRTAATEVLDDEAWPPFG